MLKDEIIKVPLSKLNKEVNNTIELFYSPLYFSNMLQSRTDD